MEDVQLWNEEVRRDLETKLKIYRDLNVSAERRPVIFTNTNHVGLWSAKTNPIIRTNEPLTPIPFEYNPSLADITSEAMTIFRDIEREQELSSFIVHLFEVGIDSPELLPSRVQLHVLFSPAQMPLRNPCSLYFNNPCYLSPQPNRSGTLSQPYTTKVRVRQYTFASGTAESTLSDCRVAIVFDAEPSTSVQTVERPQRPLTFVSRSTNQPLNCQFAHIEWRLGKELRTHLRGKLYQFLNRSWSGSRRSIIFTHEPGWWITEFTSTVVVTGPPPPIPSDYDHEYFNIEEDALGYVSDMALREHSPEFFVSSTRLGAEDNLQMHMLFSDTRDLIISYYENRDKLPLVSESKPYKCTRRVDCEYRQYPENKSDRRFLKNNFSMSRKIKKLRVRTSASSNFWWFGYSQLDDLRPIANRLGSVLRSHLDVMLTSFIKRPHNTKWSMPVIFTNDKYLWVTSRPIVIMPWEIPPMPPHYDYDSFDIVQDVADYLRKLFTRERETRLPFYLSTLTFGEKASSQIHFLMTQHNDKWRYLYVNPDELRRDTKLTLSEPRSGRVSQGPSTSATTVETGEPPVKRQSLSEPGTSSTPSLESTEESPTPGPSTRK